MIKPPYKTVVRKDNETSTAFVVPDHPDAKSLDTVDRCGIGFIYATDSDPDSPSYDDFTPACVVHDYYYQLHADGGIVGPRKRIDEKFYEIMDAIVRDAETSERLNRRATSDSFILGKIGLTEFVAANLKSRARIFKMKTKKWIYYGLARVGGLVPWLLHGRR